MCTSSIVCKMFNNSKIYSNGYHCRRKEKKVHDIREISLEMDEEASERDLVAVVVAGTEGRLGLLM